MHTDKGLNKETSSELGTEAGNQDVLQGPMVWVHGTQLQGLGGA